MRLVQFTHMGVPIWTNPELVLWVQPKGGGTRICLGAGGTSRERGEVLTLTEPIEEVVRALTEEPALVQEHERLKRLAETTAQSYMTWEQMAERRGAAGLSDTERHQWAEAEARAITAVRDLEWFVAIHPEFNEQAQS